MLPPLPDTPHGLEELTTYLRAVMAETATLSVAGADRHLSPRSYCQELIGWLKTHPQIGTPFAYEIDGRHMMRLSGKGKEMVRELVKQVKNEEVS
jgi:hypothetical protein